MEVDHLPFLWHVGPFGCRCEENRIIFFTMSRECGKICAVLGLSSSKDRPLLRPLGSNMLNVEDRDVQQKPANNINKKDFIPNINMESFNKV